MAPGQVLVVLVVMSQDQHNEDLTQRTIGGKVTMARLDKLRIPA